MTDAHLVDNSLSFASFSNILDNRILRALSDLGFARPTLIQSKAIPLALEGRDILARARTGSGKTGAYCIPVVQKILTSKASASSSNAGHGTRALILVPNRELGEQVTRHVKGIARYCEKEVIVVNVAGSNSSKLQQLILADRPDIIVGTPARVLPLLVSKSLSLDLLETLVVDEADLILSYGHDEDIRSMFKDGHIPKICQSLLMSATMTEDVLALKGLALRSPAILRLEEDEDETANLSQFYACGGEADKFLLTYVILKLKLIKGKCIIFVNSVERSYRLKLFLEQFSIRSCVLNSELPLNSRYHVVQEFNRGAYDYIIATDESSEVRVIEAPTPQTALTTAPTENTAEPASVDDIPKSDKAAGKRKRDGSPLRKPKTNKRKREDEYGASRGVDFVDVACVINFDLPRSADDYTHRVGRTARAGRSGMSLSFVVTEDKLEPEKTLPYDGVQHEEALFKKVEEEQAGRGSKLKEYKFDPKQVEAFRYRTSDALRAVSKNAIREARLKELKVEMLNSDRLKAHFEDNPLDLEYLRHDRPLNPTRVQTEMKHVPEYLLPRAAQSTNEETEGHTPFRQDKRRGGGGRGRGRGRGHGRGGSGGKRRDPLRSF